MRQAFRAKRYFSLVNYLEICAKRHPDFAVRQAFSEKQHFSFVNYQNICGKQHPDSAARQGLLLFDSSVFIFVSSISFS